MPPEERLLSASEVADLFQVSTHTVSRWVRTGKLRAIKTPGGTLRFLRGDIDNALVPVEKPEAEAS